MSRRNAWYFSFGKVILICRITRSSSGDILDRFVSLSCPYFWNQFSAILAASQIYFVNILIIGYNIKGWSKSFSLQSALRSSYKAFQLGDCRSMTKKSTKKLYSSSAVHFEAKNFLTGPLYCILYLEYRQNKAGWLPRSPRIDSKNTGKMRRQNGQVSQVKWKLQSFLLLQTFK